jgi:hypothetical protein
VDLKEWASAHVAHAGPTGLSGDAARDYVELADGYYAPRSYTADIDDPHLPCQIILDVYVDDDRVPYCRSAQFLARPGEPGLGWEEIRVPMRTLLERTLTWIAGPLRVVTGAVGDPDGPGIRLTLTSRAAADDEVAAAVRGRRPRRRRAPVTDERLREVARLYREALKSPAPGIHSRPRKYVREQLAAAGDFYSVDTVAKWVSAAREQGLLGPAPGPGKAGAVRKRRKR